MADQLLMYDTAVSEWITTNFDGLIATKTLRKLIGTPDRAFAEYVTPTGLDPDGVAELPRVALTVEDFEIDPLRFSPAKLRFLGYTDAEKLKLWQAKHPTPINLMYTLNFWTEYKREMNLLVQALAVLFRSGRCPITVDIDTVDSNNVYGSKILHMVREGGIVNTGNIPEPGREETELRRTFNFYLEGWLWDLDVTESYIVKQVELNIRDYDSEDLLEIARTPKQRMIWEGDGSEVSFGPTAVPFLPIVARTLIIDATIGGDNNRIHDDGVGGLLGSGFASGSVNYVTGEVTIEYDVAPDNDTDVTVAYYTSFT